MPRTTLYGLTYTVEMALSAATGGYGVWDAGLWGTALWGPDIVWTDVSQWCAGITIRRAFDRLFQGWDGGTCTLYLRNEDGRFNPDNLSGPYVAAGVTMVRPWRPIRVRLGWAGITYPAFAGYTKGLPEQYIQPFPGGGGALVTVDCGDEFISLARFGGLNVDPIGGGESTGTRIHRILNAANHTGLRNIAYGRMTVQPTTLANNTVVDLKLTADSEGSAVYVGKDGTVIFEDLFAPVEQTRSNTVQVTFGDGGGTELPYSDIVPDYSADTLVNIAAFARVGGDEVVSADATSRALNGDSRDPRSDLVCETDTQVKTLADLWVQRFKDPENRFAQITIKPRNRPSVLFPQVLGREVRDLLRVKRRPPGGLLVSKDVFLSGISHSITSDDFVTVFELAGSQPWTTTPFVAASRFDQSTWGSATWFY